VRLSVFFVTADNACVYLALPHIVVWGDSHINSRIDEPEMIIRWSRRLLYVLLFIMLYFARWDLPFTYGYVPAVVIFVYLGLYHTRGDMNT